MKESKYNTDSTKQMINQLKDLGFFEKFKQLSVNEIFDSLHQQRINEYSNLFKRHYDPGMEMQQYELLALDSSQSVFGDTEASVGKGNNVYVKLLMSFSAASGGQFVPESINEVWDSENGPVHVNFKSNGASIKFEASYYDDYIDEKIFDLINTEMLKKGEQKFYFLTGGKDWEFGQEYMFIRMTHSQKESVQKVLGWKFLDN